MFSFIYFTYSGHTVHLHIIFRGNWARAVDKRYGKIQYLESRSKELFLIRFFFSVLRR